VKATNKRLQKRLNGVARLLEEGNESQNVDLKEGSATEDELDNGEGDEDSGIVKEAEI
jgi:hypothetical protein